MKAEETKTQIEETKTTNNAARRIERTAKRAEKKESNGTWQRVVIGGVVGMVFGGAGAFGTTVVIDELLEAEHLEDAALAEAEGEDVALPEDSYVTVDDTIQVAQVSDSLSFGEAFAAARAEVGAGGVFEWNGGVYGTYYAEEWDNMTAEERTEFGSQINYNVTSTTTSNYAEEVVEPEPVVVTEMVEPEQEPEPVVVPEVVEPEQVQVEIQMVDVASVGDSDVQIVGIGESVLSDGSIVSVEQVLVDGEDVFYIDTNGDGIYNVTATDLNNDGVISEGEYVDVQNAGNMADTFDPNMGIAQEQCVASNEIVDYMGDDCNLA